MTESDGNEIICGETVDHNQDITFQDEDGIVWVCRDCGAEGWEDLA